MENNSKTTYKLKEQIAKYSEDLGAGFKKPTKKFIRQIIFGIQASKDIKISNISRMLKEDIPLIKTENRLTRNLNRYDLTEGLEKSVLKKAERRIKSGTVLALDLSDIRKEYAKKMEYLAKVYDGSTGDTHSTGYWLCSVIGADVSGEELIPLYQELFSQKAENFESENIQIIKAITAVREVSKKRGVWTMDRGCDRKKLFEHFLEEKLDFVIRLASRRDVLFMGRERNVCSVAKKCGCPEKIEVKINQDGQEDRKEVYAGSEMIRLPFCEERELKLVVVKGFGEEPLMLLTSLTEKDPEEILEIYLSRWKCEESFRFMKQAYKLEDIRVRIYRSLRNLVCLVLAVFYFVSVELGRKMKTSILLKKIFAKAKRFFYIPAFKHYAVADGIYALLFACAKGIDNLSIKLQKDELTLPLPLF